MSTTETGIDYRAMFDREYIGAWDLAKDTTVTIERVEAKDLVSAGGRKAKKPVIYFRGSQKGFALNKTNAKTIANLYGNNTAQWAGKAITIYATKTEMAGQVVDCIRVRNTVPERKGRNSEAAAEVAE